MKGHVHSKDHSYEFQTFVSKGASWEFAVHDMQVRQVDEVKERLRKQQKEAARSKAAAKLPGSDTAAQIRAQASKIDT